MKFLDLFAGIGGFRMALENEGHECVGYVEWDTFARKSYEAIYDTEGEWTAHDITTVTDDDLELLRGRGIDLICGGFPCQAFSVAGKRGGFHDTRGTLFFEIARIAKQVKPRILLLENVKGLLSHDKGKTFGTILKSLDELGYDAEWQVLNSKNFGVPQNRERVFIVGHLRGEPRREVFPIEGENGNPLSCVGRLDIKGDDVVRRVYDSAGSSPALTTMQGGNRQPKIVQPVLTPDRPNKRQNGRRFKDDGEEMFTLTGQDRHGVMEFSEGEGISACIDANYTKCTSASNIGKGRRTHIKVREATKKGYEEASPGDSVNYSLPNSKTRRGRVGKGVANTLDTGCQQGAVTNDLRIRKLTPKECWRLQGFPDSAFHKAEAVNSNSQLYKQAGNSVTVNVVQAIARRM